MSPAANGFGEAVAREALADACEVAALDPAGAELVRLGSAAVFRLRTEPVIARVSRDLGDRAGATREVAVARWLAREDVPASRAWDIDQPVVVGERLATFWESASDREEYGSTTDLARLLTRLHALTPDPTLNLPPLDPFAKAPSRIGSSTVLSSEDRGFLYRRLDELRTAYAELNFELPAGVIHGDASVGNVIKDRDGRPLMIDLDGACIGPREWDLVLTAIYYDRFGWHTVEEYRAFVESIGHDVMDWHGYTVLGNVREFLMVTWLAGTARDADRSAELARRMADLRSDNRHRDWAPI